MTTADRARHEPAHCYHCGLPAPDSQRYTAVIAGSERTMCCPACKAVAEAIAAGGLDNYYRLRTSINAAPKTVAADPAELALLDDAEFQRSWLTPMADGSTAGEWLIDGMHCAACVWLLENHLRRLPGMLAVNVDFAGQRAYLRWQPERLRAGAIASAVAALGYEAQPYSADRAELLRREENKRALRRLGVAGLGMMQVGMCALGLYAGAIDGMEPVYRDFLRWISLVVTAPIVAYAGQPFFSGAWRGLRSRQPGMDVPVALAITLAFVASAWATLRDTGHAGIGGEVYFDSISMFIFLLLGSRYLEMRARHYNGRLSSELLSLLPRSALRLDARQQPHAVPIERLRIGDTVLVGDGQTIPADGILLDAHADVGEAALTGEFMPVRKQRGDSLLAGSINGAQPLTIRVSGVGPQLRLAAIHALSQQAQKPRLAQFVDRIASRFIIAILLLTAATYAAWWWIDAARAFWIALSVLVVSCPCALGLATPAALANATQALRRRGLLVTNGDAWEKLPLITDVVFDKTGTLTVGCMRVVAVQPYAARSADVCLDIAAALEAGSSHPIAQAFAGRGAMPATDRRSVAGRGVEGSIAGRRYRLGQPAYALEGCSGSAERALPAAQESGLWIVLADTSGPLCRFLLDDALRADAAATVAALQRRGLAVHLLSGDSSDAVAALGAQLRIDRVVAGATPEHKLRYIETLQRNHGRVLMIGDGINDIPVLAAADVSVAMSNASQLAKTSADCILLAPRLARLETLLDCAIATRAVVRQNIAWALLYNGVALPLAAAGLVAPWLGALGMSLSSLLVVGNALRLRHAARAADNASMATE